jgi:flagellin-like hook-associated protein FlgL
MEVKDGTGTKSSFDIMDSFSNALLTDSQFEQSYSANSADTAQSITYDLTNSSMVGMFDFDTGESQQNLAASTGIQPGIFTFTIDDTPTTITITDGSNDTLQGLIDEINTISNVTASLVQDDSGLTLQITSTAGAENAFSISSSDAELVALQTGVPASSSTSAQLTVVSEAADAVSGAMKLRISASREPQNWSMLLTGPEGSATVSANINSDSFTALVEAINASVTGLTATDNGDGTLSVSKTDPSSDEDVVLEDISIEGYNLAQKEPLYYIDVLDSDNEVALKLSDQNQGLSRQGTAIQSLLEHFALSRTIVGARINNADAQNTVLQDRSISIQTEISDLRDADIETLITELQTIMVTRDAARQTYSTINSQSLFDFLK